MRKRLTAGRLAIYIVLIGGSLGMAFPMAFAIVGSFCDLPDFYARPWFPVPKTPYLENYRVMFVPEFTTKIDIWRWIANTLVRIVWYVIITSIIATTNISIIFIIL